jgi:hypothetical protein
MMEVLMQRKLVGFAIVMMVFCLGAGSVGAQCDVALVSDGAELDNPDFLAALAGMGISYTVFNDNEDGSGGDIIYMDDPTFLGAWDTIVWYQSGNGGSGRSITQEEHDAVAAWLAAGGKLVVTGYDVIGSPDDPLMAALIRSSAYGDYTDGYYSDVVADHPITNGPYGSFVGQTDIEAYDSDNDEAVADGAQGAQAVAMVNYNLPDNVAKIMVTENPSTGMIVIFWNGNYDIEDWVNETSYPEVYDLMRNMMDFICQSNQPPPADAIPALAPLGLVLLVLLMAAAGVLLTVRK